MNKFYFIGEYGYAFRQLLPFLENYSGNLELITWDSVCKIIEILWPTRYKLFTAESIIGCVDGNLRDCLLLRDVEYVRKLELSGYRNICCLDEKYFSMDAHNTFGIIKKKLIYGKQFDDKPYVSIFPRKRKIQENKNNITEEHIEWLKKTYPDKIIMGHGLKKERMGFEINYCRNIYEQINVFNNSEALLSPASGLVDLALMCGCNIILTCNYPNIEKTNSHGCSIRYWDNIKNK